LGGEIEVENYIQEFPEQHYSQNGASLKMTIKQTKKLFWHSIFI
jgi:hypothetical protein|tara:strand:- start:201 stop:332 length:132 start_codon:yes stop_codon:yes gene_type:complete